ncbi:single-stranded DNA-binding protein [Pseudorhodoplanes sp.]|uniref:single-stranded DNA-binding protein n=1 Tax=Pseudorhodoplanes sp. TaxID=1934341 RepID=UPI003D107DB9
MNRATLIGHLGKDPDIRRTQDGRPIATLSLATSESWRDKQTGERREKTEWHRVVVFNEGLCKIAEGYLKKGMQVLVEGQIETRKWTDKDGVEKYTTEIVIRAFGGQIKMLGKKRDDDRADAGGAGSSSESGASGGARKPAMAGGGSRDMDDEIPF